MEHEHSPPAASTDPTDTATSTDIDIGLDHPTVDVEVTTYETVEPEYDVIVADDPHSHFDDLKQTKVSRLERVVETDGVDHFDAINAIHDGLETYHEEYAAPDGFDPIVERAYTRTVGDEDTLCVHLRGAYDNRVALSRLLMAVDEALRPVTQPRTH